MYMLRGFALFWKDQIGMNDSPISGVVGGN